MSSIQIFDRTGTKISEFNVNASRTWQLSDYGRCIFEIPIIHPKCTEDILQFGNLIYIEHPKLPAWGGVIDIPREWGKNTVIVYAYSAEYLFKFRAEENINKLSLSPGNIFKYIIDASNRSEDIRIRTGSIYTKDEAISWELNLLNYYNEVKRLADDTDNEWILTPKINNKELEFEAQWGEKLGGETTYALTEGLNIETGEAIVSENGEIFNDILGIGSGSSNKTKEKVHLFDETSIGKYGLRQTSVSIAEGEYASVEIGTRTELNKKKNPQKTFALTALDVGNTWNYINIGNTVSLHLNTIGFQNKELGMDTTVRINGMTFLEDENKLSLNCEESL